MIVIDSKSRFKRYWNRFFNLTDSVGTFIKKGSSFNNYCLIGDGTRINGRIIIKGEYDCKLGKFCAIGDNVRIITSNHSLESINLQVFLEKKITGRNNIQTGKGIEIGNNVWIGDCVIILPNVRIGNGAVIGAGSIVTKDVDAYSIVAGAPARLIKYRFDERKRNYIQASEWWNWTLEEMKENEDFFL